MNNSSENMKEYEVNNSNSLAIIGFVLSFLVPIAGLILSILGLKKSKELNGNGRGFAIAGIIISSIYMLIGIFVVIIWIIFFIILIMSETGYVNVDEYQNLTLCERAYNCVELYDGSYSCEYEDEYGKEHDIKCYYENNIK